MMEDVFVALVFFVGGIGLAFLFVYVALGLLKDDD